VEDQFSSEAWAKVSTDERIRFCLLMARAVRKLGEAADPAERKRHMDLADRWELLASEVAKAG